jgi:ATP-dependent Clp protease ATP-binding subunit ClpC
MIELRAMTDWQRLETLVRTALEDSVRPIDEAALAQEIRARIKGQDHVVDDMARLIRLQWAKRSRKRPVCNLLFLGPTGTGKTEMAKALAAHLYRDEKAMVRFDCSELSGPEAKNHLIGNPRGYVGDTQGGKLTRPMINNPKRVVLFDEVEKAYPPVMDLFLQMMGDARLTEQASGEEADFSQSIIILTSNAEAEVTGRLQREIEDYDEMVNAVKSHLVSTGTFRPEIIGRIDRVYVFRPLTGIVVAEIAILKIANAAAEYGLELAYVDPLLVWEAMQKGNKLSRFGVRELERVVNAMFGEHFVIAKEGGAKRVRLDLDADSVLAIRPTD